MSQPGSNLSERIATVALARALAPNRVGGMRAGRGVTILTVPALLAAALSGCSATSPDPMPAAEALATGLSTGDFSGVPLPHPQAAADELNEMTAAMSPAILRAEVAEVAEDETTEPADADVTLDLVWDLDGAGPLDVTWSYQSEASLTLVEQSDTEAWQVVWAPQVVHPDLAAGGTLAASRAQPPRADILGRSQSVLVTERPVERVGIDKSWLDGAGAGQSARSLARLLGIDPDTYAAQVQAAGDLAFVQALVLRKPEAEPLRDDVAAIPGGRMISDRLALAPTRDFGRPLLGVVGEATAEGVEESDGAIAAGDMVGLSGLQLRYDERLRGVPGYTVRLRPSGDSDETTVVFDSEPTPGDPLALTLDPQTQRLAEDVLAGVDSPSALVAIRPGNGHLLAVASGLGADGYSTATLGQYPPGSVFKLATTLGLLREGKDPASPLPCTDSITVNGKVFTNYSGYPDSALGDIPLRRALAESCNTAFVSQSDVVSSRRLASSAAALGVGSLPDLGFDAFVGSVPTSDDQVQHAAQMIGQGSVLMSPLAAAVMAAATTGEPVSPTLVLDPAPEESADVPNPVTANQSQALTSMMREVVTDGTAGVLANVPGPPVGGKTGTAEFGSDDPPETHAWMVSAQSDLAVAVFVEEGESGSATAGPILAEFLQRVSR